MDKDLNQNHDLPRPDVEPAVNPVEPIETTANKPTVLPAEPVVTSAESNPTVTPVEAIETMPEELATDSVSQSVESSTVISQNMPAKKNKTGLIIALVAVILVIGGLIGGYFYYQNPSKVITDAFSKMASAKKQSIAVKISDITSSGSSSSALGGVTFDGIDVNLSVDVEKISLSSNLSANLSLKGQKIPIKAKAMLVEKKDLYFYIEDMSEPVGTLLDSFSEYGAQIKTQFLPLLTKLENRWVKVSLEKLKADIKDDEDNKALVCMVDAIDKLDFNKYAEESKDAFKKNNYFKVDGTKSSDGNFVFDVTVDEEKFEAYNKSLQETDFMKSLLACGTEGDSVSTSVDSLTNETPKNMSLAVGKWNHEMVAMEAKIETKNETATDEQTQSMNLKADFSTPKTIDVKEPSDSVDFETWLKEIQTELKELGLDKVNSGSLGESDSLSL